MQTDMATYKDRKRMERDVRRRASAGWAVGTMMEHRPRGGLGRFITMGGIGALAFPPKPEITVTYTRTPEAAATAAQAETAEQIRRHAQGRRRARRLRYALGVVLAVIGLIGLPQNGGTLAVLFVLAGFCLFVWAHRTH